MRLYWWRSIRWRLALGSVLLALLTTGLLALTTLFVFDNYYQTDVKSNLHDLAHLKAQTIGASYTGRSNLGQVAKNVIQSMKDSDRLQAQIVVLSSATDEPVYPDITVTVRSTLTGYRVTPSANTAAGPMKSLVQQAGTLSAVLEFIDPVVQRTDLRTLAASIRSARTGSEVDNTFARDSLFVSPQPFSVAPIYEYSSVAGSSPRLLGFLIATIPPSGTSFVVNTVGPAVCIAALIIAALAALASIFFSRTITRPLTNLSNASRVLASGNYDARVTVNSPGELGELAQRFNDMADQLKRDVEELREQEVWRRELIMNITHDLATPLTAIAGLGEALVDGLNQTREDYEATGLIIMRETLRLRRLVQDLHVMSKVEAGALMPNLKPLRLASMVDEVFAAQIAEFERHEVEPRNAVPFDLPLLAADPDMLVRVFFNLLGNALRYTPAGGSITVGAQAHYQDNCLLIFVEDTGEGIPTDALERVFVRFYRGDTARQSSRGGSGLGLAIVQAIIEAHGGRIWAENVVEGGARISFQLPLRVRDPLSLADAATVPLTSHEIGVVARKNDMEEAISSS